MCTYKTSYYNRDNNRTDNNTKTVAYTGTDLDQTPQLQLEAFYAYNALKWCKFISRMCSYNVYYLIRRKKMHTCREFFISLYSYLIAR